MASAREETPQLLTRTALAKHLGVNRQRVGQYINAGLPVDEATNRINISVAMRWVEENVAHERRGSWADEGHSLNELRRRREAVRVQREQLELERTRDELIERETVQRFVAGRAKLERDAWLAWASRAAAVLASELGGEVGIVFPILEREVRDQLGQLAETPMGGVTV
ncbi:MAG: hypothetical protein ROR55_03355 [Devosia sp.]